MSVVMVGMMGGRYGYLESIFAYLLRLVFEEFPEIVGSHAIIEIVLCGVLPWMILSCIHLSSLLSITIKHIQY